MSFALRWSNFLALLVICAFAGTGISQAQTIPLRGRIVDAETGQIVAARLYVQSSEGQWYFAQSIPSDGTAIEYKRQVSPTSLEQHVTLSAHPFVVDVPAGKYTLTVERGKEYSPLVQTIDVSPESKEVTLSIKRWINMASLGWYSGDVHAHRALSEMPNLVMAEDLNVAMPLSHWTTVAETGPITGNRIKAAAPKPEWIAVDATHGIYPLNTEYEIFTVNEKSHTLGAVLLCGQKSVLDQGVPPVRRIAERAHADGAFLDLEKHSWAWTPMIVPLMKVDLFELANNHCWRTEFGFPGWTVDAAAKYMKLSMTDKGFTEQGWLDFGFKSYYAYLNCGFRMMPSAGTGAGVHPVPLGFGRVYVHVPGEFTYDKWKANLLAGHSFVTTGPMMRLTFNDQQAGHAFQPKAEPASVRVHGVVESNTPHSKLTRIMILQNGNVVWSAVPSRGVIGPHVDQTISFDRSGWLAVCAFEVAGQRLRFAHSAPVFVDIPGKPAIPKMVEVEHFIERIERELARHKGVLNADAIAEYDEALMIYRDLLSRAE